MNRIENYFITYMSALHRREGRLKIQMYERWEDAGNLHHMN